MGTGKYVYTDYKAQAFTVAEASYTIGTDSGTEFVSEETMFFADQDCWVQFNDDTNWIKIKKNAYNTFKRKLFKVAVKRITADGTLDIWAEGSLSR